MEVSSAISLPYSRYRLYHMHMHSQGYVMLADMIGSRTANRRGLGRRVDEALAALSGELGPALGLENNGGRSSHSQQELYVPPRRTKGIDEFAVLLATPTLAFAVLVAVNEAVAPARFRAALAHGEIDTGLEGRDIREMDGTAFHRAARGLEVARSTKHEFCVELPGLSASEHGLLVASTALHCAVHADLTLTQLETLRSYRRTHSQTDSASELGKSQPTISKALRAARYQELMHLEDAVQYLLHDVHLRVAGVH